MNKMTYKLQSIIEANQYRIISGEKFVWECYGHNARFMDFEANPINTKETNTENNISCVFDTRNYNVYEICFVAKNKAYRWIHPDFIKANKKECKKKNIRFENCYDGVDYIEIEVFADIMEKIKSFVQTGEYDQRVQLPLNLNNDELLTLFQMAHDRDITLNKLVEEILTQSIDSIDEKEKNPDNDSKQPKINK